MEYMISMAMAIPVIGPYVVIAMKIALGASAVVTAIVAMAHAAIAVLKALSMMPFLSMIHLDKLADKLKAKTEGAEGFYMTKIHPILNRLSLIPIPAKK
jgi:hypothetical protein